MSQIKVFTEKQLNYARKTNMLSYMLERGEPFRQVSSKFVEHREHDSLRANIKTGVLNWYSQNLTSWNNAIEFSMAFFNESFETTVEDLLQFQRTQRVMDRSTNRSVTNKNVLENKLEPFTLTHLSTMGNYDTNVLSQKGREYLRSRYLSDETIGYLEKLNLVSTDNKNNLLFKHIDIGIGKTGNIVGCDIQGTYARSLDKRVSLNDKGKLKLDRKYFKGMGENSMSKRGFLFGVNVAYSVPLTLFVTEGPIESASLMELQKESLPINTWFLSLSGLKEDTFWEVKALLQELTKAPKVESILAVNNDEKGQEFVQNVHETYQDEKEYQFAHTLKLLLPELENGDWNEQLELLKTGVLNSRSEKLKEKREAEKLVQSMQLSYMERV
ncbi:toprim domain-containing protein [Enterococcus faecium]|uniref:toprim domain-containing protein n=1 Tax=Enterococcus faecium TaxID=1352 RepID=UPI000A18980F|nr:toprim domain-containing protein [Enterococcus faecium]MCE3178521.1 toprim domain-containing protein [Enterococcus faecium]MCE3184031.1 toprim domain-containing protein [Enterococcus faecium]MCU2104488.1 toprim domain-containing protein [Enterococcus faecium]MCU2185789.1 toprim domain-containing protein [Enterococcus faecium]MCU2188675.1 toprim domain-containing protein [Enterococcus faecium]